MAQQSSDFVSVYEDQNSTSNNVHRNYSQHEDVSKNRSSRQFQVSQKNHVRMPSLIGDLSYWSKLRYIGNKAWPVKYVNNKKDLYQKAHGHFYQSD